MGFKDSLEEQIKQKMKSSYMNFIDVNEAEKWSPEGYSIKNISRLFYLDSKRAIIDDKSPAFEKLRNTIRQSGVDAYIIEGMGALIQGRKRDDLDPDKLIMILDKLYEESETAKHFSDQYKITNKISKLCRLFSKQLEHLIDDFKGGETIKGFCKLGS